MAHSSKATKRLLWIIGGLVILIVILGVVGRVTGIFGAGGDATSVETAEAQVRAITQVVTASGRVQPEVEVSISPDVSGEVIELPVKEGDYVSRGRLLARIKPDFYATQVEQAKAGVLQARATAAQREADLLQAEAALKRQNDLFEKSAISKSALEDAQTQFEVAKAGLEASRYAVQSAAARLREAEEQVRKTAIYSPMDGTISKLDIELGERVVGTSQMAGTEMMRVARLDQMEVEVEVNENEIVHVALSDTATIDVDAYPERSFRGIVTEIANSAQTTAAGTQEQVTEFPVKIRILDPHNVDAASSVDQIVTSGEVPMPRAGIAKFRPGMSATVDVYAETVFDVVAIPIQAVTVRDFSALPDTTDGDDAGLDSAAERDDRSSMEEDLRKVVFIVVDGKAKMVEVETGISDDTHIEIHTGLAGGEHVVVGPYRAVSRDLNDGDVVDVDEGGARRAGFVASGS